MVKIKGVLITLMLGLNLIMSTPQHAQALPSATMELSSPSITQGESFTIDVVAGGVTDFDPFWGLDELLAYGFDVTYNPAAFSYNGATVAPPFFDDSAFFPDTDVAGSAFPGISGDDILLASLNFTSLLPGSYSIGITSIFSNPNQGLITWLYPEVDLTTSLDLCVATEPVPEPATLLLFGTGLAGLLGTKRRKL